MIESRAFLERVFMAGVRAADPRVATRKAVEGLNDVSHSVVVISAGKGAHAMATGAVEALKERGIRVVNGVVVANEENPAAEHGLEARAGDHPVPGDGSFAAADRVLDVVRRTTPDLDATVLISGGATSLMAAPVDGLSGEDLRAAFTALLSSGADINVMNAIRKRLLRFGGGRLAVALSARRIHCLIASDVVGNDLGSIASGPCVADGSSATDARARAIAANAWESLPATARSLIDGMADGRIPDLPPVNHPRFKTTHVRIILDRLVATRGAAEAAKREGVAVDVVDEPVKGEASVAGMQMASRLVRSGGAKCVIWSGETTVTLDGPGGKGGRCQELALAAAKVLADAGDDAKGITLLAAGTDGRDGANDSAGAVVDWTTWQAIVDRGINPEEALRRHTSYDALDPVGALLKTGPTGTNVNDLMIGLKQ